MGDDRQFRLLTQVGRPDEEVHGFGDAEVLVIVQGREIEPGPYTHPALADEMEREWESDVASGRSAPTDP